MQWIGPYTNHDHLERPITDTCGFAAMTCKDGGTSCDEQMTTLTNIQGSFTKQQPSVSKHAGQMGLIPVNPLPGIRRQPTSTVASSFVCSLACGIRRILTLPCLLSEWVQGNKVHNKSLHCSWNQGQTCLQTSVKQVNALCRSEQNVRSKQ